MDRKIAVFAAGIVIAVNVFVIGLCKGIEDGYILKERELNPDGTFGDPFASAYSVISASHFAVVFLSVFLVVALLMKDRWFSNLIAVSSILISILIVLSGHGQKIDAIERLTTNGAGWNPEPIRQMIGFDYFSIAMLVALLTYLTVMMLRRAYKTKMQSNG